MLLAEGLAAQAERQAAIARENTNIRVAAPANKVKVRKPDDFDGSRDRVDYFLQQLKGYLAQEPNLLMEAQLNIALGFCVGKIAGTWADRQATMIAENKEGRLTGIADFEKKIRDTFGDPERGSTARHQLQLLRQRGKPIEQFIIDFELLEADAELDEVALIEHWKRAIDKHIWEKCYEALEIPKTLKEWKDRCLIYDRNFRRRAEESALRNNNLPVKKFSPYSQNFPSCFNNSFGKIQIDPILLIISITTLTIFELLLLLTIRTNLLLQILNLPILHMFPWKLTAPEDLRQPTCNVVL